MDKKSKKWKRLAAMVCVGLGVMTGAAGSLPAAQAEPYGVVMDMRTSQTIPYRIQNFTPYRLELVTENQNNMGELRFANGVPNTIAPITEKGGNHSAMMYVMYKSYQGQGVWSPVYRLRAPSGNYINIEFKTDVQAERMKNVKMDALPFIKNVVSCVGNIGGLVADPANIGGYIDLVVNIKSAVDSYNAIEVTDFEYVAGVGYVYGTSQSNASNLMLKNDGVVMQVGDGSSGEQIVIETIAVRQKPRVLWTGESGPLPGEGKKKATITVGGKQFAGVNIYTQAQYLTCASIVVAKDIMNIDRDEEYSASAADANLSDTATSNDMGNGMSAGNFDTATSNDMGNGMSAGNFDTATSNDMGNGMSAGNFAGSEGYEEPMKETDMDLAGAMNEECERLAKRLAEPIVMRKEGDKYLWFSGKMTKLTSGERIDVYEALYEAQKKKNKSMMENPLLPAQLRQALAGTAGFDEAVAQGEISDQELAVKLRRALKHLGIEESEAASGQGNDVNSWNNGF